MPAPLPRVEGRRSRVPRGDQAVGQQWAERVARLGYGSRDAESGDVSDGETGVSAGIDVGEGDEIHVDVHGDAVVRASVANLEAERGDLGFGTITQHVDAGCLDLASRVDAAGCEPCYHRALDAPYHPA